MDRELDYFKSAINLVAYAVSQGYKKDAHESSKRSVVLRLQNDKIVVATNPQGYGIYFSVRDTSDHGTLIDFVQNRQRLNLGQLRQHLRHWNPSFSYCPKDYEPLPSSIDHQQIAVRWATMAGINRDHDYLIHHRHLSPQILIDHRFVGTIKTDARNNALFLHRDRHGVSGYEIKNVGFTGFARGGQKALWYTTNLKAAKSIVIVESAIDGLSHAQLHPTESAYVSIAGTLSAKQRDLIQGLVIKATARTVEVVVATDNDEPGEQYYADIARLAGSATIRRDRPTYKDWNEELQQGTSV